MKKLLEWRLAQVTCICFLDAMVEEWHEAKVFGNVVEKERTRLLGHMFCELSLNDYSLLRRFRPSEFAAASVALAFAVVRESKRRTWQLRDTPLKNLGREELARAHLAAEELQVLHTRLHANENKGSFSVVRDKYTMPEKYAVAELTTLSYNLVLA